jgi:hypothetical protein
MKNPNGRRVFSGDEQANSEANQPKSELCSRKKTKKPLWPAMQGRFFLFFFVLLHCERLVWFA